MKWKFPVFCLFLVLVMGACNASGGGGGGGGGQNFLIGTWASSMNGSTATFTLNSDNSFSFAVIDASIVQEGTVVVNESAMTLEVTYTYFTINGTPQDTHGTVTADYSLTSDHNTLTIVPKGQPAQVYTRVTSTEFEGTWVLSSGGTTSTLVFTMSTLTATDTGASPGTFNGIILAFDETAKHFLMICIASSGSYAGYGIVPGSLLYWLYSVSGNSLMLRETGTGYPLPPADIGPYIKQ